MINTQKVMAEITQEITPPVGVGKFNERLLMRNDMIVDACTVKANELQAIVDRLRDMADKLKKDGPAAAEAIAKYVDYMDQSQQIVSSIRMVGTQK